MSYSADNYLSQLKALLPLGDLWDSFRQSGTLFSAFLDAFAQTFARIDARAEDLLDESDPRTTYELLPEWETEAGLPDTCTTQADTIQERRDALVSKLTSIGDQSRPYFISIAAELGYEITITEFRPFVAGSDAGDVISNGDWIYTWQVNAAEETIRPFVAGSGTGELLRDWGNEILECVINKYKPAHTLVQFAYGG